MCIKEVRESCNGFVQRELKIAQDQLVDQGETIPQCIKAMLVEEEEEKFPVFNKLVDELALIKELVNDQWKLTIKEITFYDSCAFLNLKNKLIVVIVDFCSWQIVHNLKFWNEKWS